MPTSAPGNPEATPLRHLAGFTLLELLVVVSLIALATAGVGLALRDSTQTELNQDAQRLAALLNAAHAQARTSGVAVPWRASPNGVWLGATHHTWALGQTRLQPEQGRLDPEPLLPPMRLVLTHGSLQLGVGTNGVHPFEPQAVPAP